MKLYRFNILIFFILFYLGPLNAAQVLVFKTQATGQASEKIAKALSPLIADEISKRKGMSALSSFEIEVWLKHKANLQALGCNDSKCMINIANQMGSELILASNLTKLGRKWALTLSILNTETGRSVRRITGTYSGSEDILFELVKVSMKRLFNEKLKVELETPRFLSRGGFEALVLSFDREILRNSKRTTPLRKQMLLDIVYTGLDFDAAPKIELLRLTASRAIGKIKILMLTVDSALKLDNLLKAYELWQAIFDDLKRIAEIRKRGRTHGITPDASYLRFEPSRPIIWVSKSKREAYWKASKIARKVAVKAIQAIQRKNLRSFKSNFFKKFRSQAGRSYKEYQEKRRKNKHRCELLPKIAHSPWQYENAVDLYKKNKKTVIYVRCFRGKKAYTENRIWLRKLKGVWKLNHW